MIDNQIEFVPKKPTDIKYQEQITGYMNKFNTNQPAARALVARDLVNVSKENKREKAEENSMTDVLTGLRNHRYFMGDIKQDYIGELGQEFGEAIRFDHDLTLLMVDIDNFKNVNDRYGHSVGNDFLRTLADAMRRSFRQIDILARYGGEEFCILLPETDINNMKLLVDRFHENFKVIQKESGILEKNNVDTIQTISIGATSLKNSDGKLRYGNGDNNKYEVFLKEADKAMYVAKALGKNRTVIFDSPEYLKNAKR